MEKSMHSTTEENNSKLTSAHQDDKAEVSQQTKTATIDSHSGKRVLSDRIDEVSKAIEKAKASFDAINTLLSTLNGTATMRIEALNKQLDLVIHQVEDIRGTCVTALLREAQTELTKTASSRERRKYAQHDRRRRVFIKKAGELLKQCPGNLSAVMDMDMDMQGSLIRLHTLKVHAPNQVKVKVKEPHQLPETSSVVTMSETCVASLKETLQLYQSKADELTESETGAHVMLIGSTSYSRAGKVSVFDSLRNKWSTRQPMIEERYEMAAVSWNSKVIVAGSFSNTDKMKSVEQYDPQTNSWTPFPDMQVGRCNHALVDLNGSLYAIGGTDKDQKVLSSAERFNAETNSWEQAFTLQNARACHGAATATLRSCVIITGGYTDDSFGSASCEIYRGQGLKSAFTAPLNIGRGRHAAAAHLDAVYVFGGLNKEHEDTTSVEQFDWHAEQWTVLNITTCSDSPSFLAAACCNGRVYVTNYYGYSPRMYCFNESSGFTLAAQLPEPLEYCVATCVKLNYSKNKKADQIATSGQLPITTASNTQSLQLSHNKNTKNLLVCVGGDDLPRKAARTSVYDPESNSWHHIQQTNTSLLRVPSAVTWNNTVVVAGGLTKLDPPLIYAGGKCRRYYEPSVFVKQFDAFTGKWKALPDLNRPRLGHALVNVKGTLYVFGGEQHFRKDASYKIERYDANEQKWIGEDCKLYGALVAAVCHKGVVLTGDATVNCGLYDTERKSFTTIAMLNIGRCEHAAAAHNDTVYVFGGVTSDSSPELLDAIEQYDADANSWTLLNVRLTQARFDLTAACVGDKLYIVGGNKFSPDSSLDLVDVFDPSRMECSAVTQLPAPEVRLPVAVLTVSLDQFQRLIDQREDYAVAD